MTSNSSSDVCLWPVSFFFFAVWSLVPLVLVFAFVISAVRRKFCFVCFFFLLFSNCFRGFFLRRSGRITNKKKPSLSHLCPDLFVETNYFFSLFGSDRIISTFFNLNTLLWFESVCCSLCHAINACLWVLFFSLWAALKKTEWELFVSNF